ncbi:MAG: hypothetical protein PHP23_14460 [Desulfobacterales bacterium]|nr:hypothetical protein [Desulfobacterales bacterium]MDD4071996.1 hypothetical protein [Desulfobacterales bacterium]MDD4392313.1 hypothetical protein [Desulfobacterales bacterium]
MPLEQDIVLIYFEGKPFLFARIEGISPDIKRDWYNIRLLILQVPLQVVTWTLKKAYINGEEFTMGGNKMRIEKVLVPESQPEPGQDINRPASNTAGSGNVISFNDLKKRN